MVRRFRMTLVMFVVVALLMGLWTQRTALLQQLAHDSLDPETGQLTLPGLSAPVTVRRDELGIPRIEAENLRDLSRATGWVMASDRFEQMLNFVLVAQGRLAELAGPVALNMDVYMRTLGVHEIAMRQCQALSPDMRELLGDFADGVNAWMADHRDRMPFGVALAGYQPEPWKAENACDIFALINLGLGVNLQEELAFINLAAKVGVDKAAWLLPIYPDEPIDHAEAAKLSGLNLQALARDATALQTLAGQLQTQGLSSGMAASNNWAVAPGRTAGGASIVANDTHLLLEHPPLWMLMQVRTPEYSAGGIALAGIPGIVAGSNGHVGWGMTMVMADSQDVFLEKLRFENGRWEALWQGTWEPVATREEVFHVRGQDEPVRRTLRRTRHGPLLNEAVAGDRVNPLLPVPTASRYGLAVSQTSEVPDRTMEAVLRLGLARSAEEAREIVRDIRFIHLNLVYGDRDHIGWQVTGRYPIRGKGTGHFPSPGWTGEYDWQGWVDVAQQPAAWDPEQGYLATANHRTVRDPGFVMSSSWYYPERFERINEVLAANDRQTLASTEQLQFDRKNVLVGKIQQQWQTPAVSRALAQAILALPEGERAHAESALRQILNFDGVMTPESSEALYWGVFEHLMMRETFGDELGLDTPAWQSLVFTGGLAYSAQQDHLLGREDSPFWDDIRTPEAETKWTILARALARIEPWLTQTLGEDQAHWQWGQLHTYTWKSGASQFRPWLSEGEQLALGALTDFLDRGPYPAGGDRNTVNVAGHSTGESFDVWNIPAMRLIVDFSQPDPLHVINSGGQSGNPASPHYDDGIAVWLKPGNRPMPLSDAAAEKQYNRVLRLLPGAQTLQ